MQELPGGNRNEVWLIEVDGTQAVLRHSSRPSPQLDWEHELLAHLRRRGLPVPAVIPATRGHRSVQGWHVLSHIDGEVLADASDPRLDQALSDVHEATKGWLQRPGWRTARELLAEERGGDVDLAVMPPELVAEVREAWAALPPARFCVVHGDAGPGNAIISRDGYCVLIDWDESRVDNPAFDTGRDLAAQRAQLAWEIATCWIPEPRYAKSLVPKLLELPG